MSSRIWLVNFVLMVVVIFFGLKAYGLWSEGKKWPLEADSLRKPLPWPEKKVAKRNVPPESDYEVIVTNNLFWRTRSEVKPQEEEKKVETKPKAVGRTLKILEGAVGRTNLYGVIIVDDHREALIGEVPAGKSARSGERGVKRAKVGDTVGRFKMKEISDKSVLLTAKGHEWRIALFDKDKPKKRAQVKKNDGPIVIVGGSKIKSVLTDAKTVKKGPTPKPAVSKRETSSKPQDKKKTLPVPNDRSKTRKR